MSERARPGGWEPGDRSPARRGSVPQWSETRPRSEAHITLVSGLDGRVATVDEDDLAADGIRGGRSQDRTRSAISTGRPNRPDGIWAFIGSPFSGAPQACRPISVRNTVGATAREHLWC